MSDIPRSGSAVSCQQVIDGAFEFLDASLDDIQQPAFVAHITMCPRCAVYMRHARALLECVSTTARIYKAPVGLRRRILDALVELEDSVPE
ncbi:MAG: hypothetical protein M3081_02200 [Gemmatimonadota bacterium]|nr:hypothetical protein [Gemmatimonadota bacterium]